MNDVTSESAVDDALSPTDLARAIEADDSLSLLDVRDRDEVETWAIEGPSVERVHLPYAKFLQAKVTGGVADLAAEIALCEPITVVCGRGAASAEVADLLSVTGVEARNLADGMDGWARVYRSAALDTDSMTVRQYRRPSSGCLAYLVATDGEAAVIDPLRAFTEHYATDAAELGVELRYAIDTHIHADHVSGIRRLADETGAEAVLPETATKRGATFDVTTVADGGALALGDIELEAIHAPGHTSGMTVFRVENVLLTGDGLFLADAPRPDLEAGAAGARELAATLHGTLTERLAPLSDDLLVAPGHYGPTTRPAANGTYTARLGDLRERLSAFSMEREQFVASVRSGMGPRPANHERIVAVNCGHEAIGDEEAFELELGPNNCAAAPAE